MEFALSGRPNLYGISEVRGTAATVSVRGDLRNSYWPSNIVGATTWIRRTYKTLQRRKHLENLDGDGSLVLKCILNLLTVGIKSMWVNR